MKLLDTFREIHILVSPLPEKSPILAAFLDRLHKWEIKHVMEGTEVAVGFIQLCSHC
jgi:hypothetical protein